MTAGLLQVSAAGFAQRMTFTRKQVSLEQIFKEITKQTGYQILYADKGIDAAKVINADFKNADLAEVMDKCLQKQPLSYVIEDKSIVIRIKEKSIFDKVLDYINAIDLKGKVLDEKGQPLPKATIKVKGSNRAVFTDENGAFHLDNLDENAVLEVYYLGYKTKEITAAALKANPSVQMEIKAGELDEVTVMVNTGYQNIPKERATGSFTQISNETINKQVGGNILRRLEGIASGISFDKSGSRPGITVRGLSSINGSNAPLIILDNFPYEGDVNNINPNDIENITILKDAAAASIWGTRAGNGVIVITSKKGAFNAPLKIQFNSNVTITDRPDLFDIKQMSTSDFIDVEQQLYAKGKFDAQIKSKSKPELSEVLELLIANKSDAKQRIDELRNYDIRNDAMKYLYNTAVDQRYALSFQGGSKTMTYNVSGGYDKNISSLSEQYNRVNLRVANVFKPIEKLQISTSLYYTRSSNESGKPRYDGASIDGKRIYPYTRLKDANGNDIPVDVFRRTYTDTAGMGKLLDWKYYPLYDYKHNTLTNNIQSILANVGLRYELTKDLNVDLKYQYEHQQLKGKHLKDVNSFDARTTINRYSKLNRKTGVVDYVAPYGGILTNSEASVISQNARAQLNYQKTIGDHSIAALAGTEVRQISTISSAYSVYGYDDDLLKTGKVDYLHSAPDFIDGSLQFLPDGIRADDRLNNYISLFGNASYTYKQRYTLSGSVRKDMSNLFGVSTNDKGIPLWSAGASWNISDESFYDVSFLPYLKLRTTYGFSGNLDSRKSAVTTFRSLSPAFYTSLPQSIVDQFANPELRWEKVKMFNIGADFQLINNVLSGSIEYYHKKGLDLFGPAEMDYTTNGAGVITKNVANMAGKGIDVELSSRIIDRQFKWTQQFNFSYNTNTVTKYFERSTYGSDYINDGSSVFPRVGEPLYTIVSHKWAGLDPLTGDPQGYLNGQVSKDYKEFIGPKSLIDNMVFHGSATPVVFGNFLNTVSWKELYLTVNVTYKMGYYFRRKSINYNDLTGNNVRIGHADFASRWQKPGDEKNTNVPSFIYPDDLNRNSFYNGSEVLVSRADHVRLQFVNLAYNLKRTQWLKLPVQQVQFFANASNLGILWRANKFKVDPEYNNSITPSGSFSLGLRADF